LDKANTGGSHVSENSPPDAHLARTAHLGLAKLRAYSFRVREIPVYLAAVVVDPWQKWDYFELGVEQGDWTELEVESGRALVQQLWTGEYRKSALESRSLRNTDNLSATRVEPVTRILDEPEEHYRQWKAKTQRITPGIHPYPIIFVNQILDRY